MAISWLSDWAKRKKITIDNTNIDNDLIHFPVPIVLNDQQLDIFNEVGLNSKKIAFTSSDATTQLYGEIECWENSSAGSKGTADATYDFGSSGGGLEGFTAYGSPTDNGTYYTFNGTDNGLYKTTDLGDSSDEVIFMTFRCHDKNKGSIQILWKDGGSYNGIAVGIDVDGNLGIFGASLGVVTSILIKPENYENDVWYDIYFTKSRITLVDHATSVNIYTQTGTVTAGDGSSPESVGVCYESSPISGVTYSSWGEFFDGDIDTIEVYPVAELTAPVPYKAVIWVSKSSWTIYSSTPTELYIYFDSTKADNTTYIGNVGDSAAQNVWDSNFEFVCHCAQDPSGGSNAVKDSTSNTHHLTASGSMTSGDLIDGYIGKAISLDGTDDFLYTASASDGLDITDDFTLEVVLRPFFTNIALGDVAPILSRQGYPNADVDSYGLVVNSDEELQLGTYGGNIQGQTLSLDPMFQYWAGTYESTGLTGDLFLDGVKETLSTDNYDTMAGGTNSLAVGRNNPGQYAFMDVSEVRVSTIQRSDAWILATNAFLYDTVNTYATTEIYNPATILISISPDSGQYLTTQLITISSSISDTIIYYTTDGTDPTRSSNQYTGPFYLNSNKTIKAFGVKNTFTDSDIVSATYTCFQVDEPTFLLPSGAYYDVETLSIIPPHGGQIYYRTSSTDSFKLYTQPIPFFAGTLEAYGTKTGYLNSEIVSADYEKVISGSWKNYKNLGSWNFEKSKANTKYNEGNKISSIENPVWDITSARGQKITPGHIPCGYWNNVIVTEKNKLGPINAISGPAMLDIIWLENYGGVLGRFVGVNIRGRIYLSDDGGDSWEQVSYTGNADDDCTAIFYHDDKLIVTASFKTWVSYNGGETWTKGTQIEPPYSTFTTPVVWNSNIKKYVVYGTTFPGINQANCFVSDDALTWTETYLFGSYFLFEANIFYKNFNYAIKYPSGTGTFYGRSVDCITWQNISLQNYPATRKRLVTDGHLLLYSQNQSYDGIIWTDFDYTFTYGVYKEEFDLWLLSNPESGYSLYYSFGGKVWDVVDYNFTYDFNCGVAVGNDRWIRVSTAGIGVIYRGFIN